MDKAGKILSQALENEKRRIRASHQSSDMVFALIEILRSIDYHFYVLNQEIEVEDKDFLLEKYKFGWSLAFLLFYKEHYLTDKVPLFKFDESDKQWVDQIIQHSGAIQLCQQFLDYCKANIMTLEMSDEHTFEFTYLLDHAGIEYYEILSLRYYHSVMDEVLKAKSKPVLEKLPIIRDQLRSIVNIYHEYFITYGGDLEIDQFYSDFGYWIMMTSQLIDEFDEKDTFGDIRYREYIDIVEDTIGSVLKHRDCCMALALKTSHRIFIRNILTYGFSRSAFLTVLNERRGWPPEKLSQIISCLTLNKENYHYHLAHPGVKPSPFFEIGTDTLMRSDYGCLGNAVFFLNRELKRKFPKDYYNAVNKREARFRNQLYSLFPEDKIIKVNESINIKFDAFQTDIDAILYDKNRSILGLFQLKWQDTFSTSMKERFSRITNLIPKSTEWISKIEAWLKATPAGEVLKKLKIETDVTYIEQVHLFVIARNHVHFTNTTLDNRATWASWFQVVEAFAKVKDPFQTNPIGELAFKLKFFSPEIRKERDSIPKPQRLTFRFSKYTITVNPL